MSQAPNIVPQGFKSRAHGPEWFTKGTDSEPQGPENVPHSKVQGTLKFPVQLKKLLLIVYIVLPW